MSSVQRTLYDLAERGLETTVFVPTPLDENERQRLNDLAGGLDEIKSSLLHGFSGLGDIVSVAFDSKEAGINEEAVFNFGWMLKTTSEMLIAFAQMQDNINYRLLLDAQAGAPVGQEPEGKVETKEPRPKS
jgi:hypothetical protein